MKTILKKFLLLYLLLTFITQYIEGIHIEAGVIGLLSSCLTLALLLFFVKPIINTILLPINLLTLNLFSWLVHFLLIYLWTIITPHVTITHWNFTGIQVGFIQISPTQLNSWQVVIVVALTIHFGYKLIEWIFR